MLQFLIALNSHSYSQKWSIVPPFMKSNVSEMGTWALRGSAINLDKQNKIRLTSLPGEDFGGLCSMHPTTFEDWTLEVHYSSISDFSTRAQTIYFSEELCPEHFNSFHGFALRINTSYVDFEGFSEVQLLINNGSNVDINYVKPAFSMMVAGFDSEIIVCIQKKDNIISISSISPENKTYFHSNFSSNINFGYFSILSETIKNSQSNDIYAIKVYQQSQSKPYDLTLKKRNSKSLSNMKQITKRRPRNPMPVCDTVRKDAIFNKANISQSPTISNLSNSEDIKTALKEISEMVKRTRQDLSLIEFAMYIDKDINANIEYAMTKIEKAYSFLNSVASDLSEHWELLITNLMILNQTYNENIINLKKSAIKTVAQMIKDDQRFKLDKAKIQDADEKTANIIVYSIMFFILLELIILIIFLISKARELPIKRD